VSSPDVELDAIWVDRLRRLNAVIEACHEPLAGNLFYEHEQEDFASSPASPIYRTKRDRFRRAVSGRRRMLEVGVNGGHSALLALSVNPRLEYHGVDLGEHAYVEPAVSWLRQEFPKRVFFYQGDSLKVLPHLAARDLDFDLLHMDGAKFNYLDDIVNASRMVSVGGGLVIVDDAETTSARIALSTLARLGVVKPVAQFPPMPSSDPNRHEIRSVVHTSLPKRALVKLFARALNGARRVKALRETDSEWAYYHPPRSG
jgi:predicted O-methyltransferase YrrM